MTQCRFLFWNVHRKDLTGEVCALASDTDADVIVLCENHAADTTSLLDALHEQVNSAFFIPNATPSSDSRFSCFCRNRCFDFDEISSETRASVRKWRMGSRSLLMTLVHGASRINSDAGNQQASFQSMVHRIKEIAKEHGIERLVWLGDFNVNPYESVMLLPQCFNAMMTKQCTKRGHRKMDDEKHDFYYNPMWGCFGDATDGPSGTFYYQGKNGNYGWNMLDQVLIHHSAVSLFRRVEILTQAGQTPLVSSKGRPTGSSTPSDHLPILVTFEGDSYE